MAGSSPAMTDYGGVVATGKLGRHPRAEARRRRAQTRLWPAGPSSFV